VVGNITSPALYIELGGILDGSCDMTGKENKIIPLVKPEEKEKKVSIQPKKG
jgi:cytoskeletal protein CcmA (bactofilin family)